MQKPIGYTRGWYMPEPETKYHVVEEDGTLVSVHHSRSLAESEASRRTDEYGIIFKVRKVTINKEDAS